MRKSKKDRQHKGQKKKNKRTKNDLQNQGRIQGGGGGAPGARPPPPPKIGKNMIFLWRKIVIFHMKYPKISRAPPPPPPPQKLEKYDFFGVKSYCILYLKPFRLNSWLQNDRYIRLLIKFLTVYMCITFHFLHEH